MILLITSHQGVTHNFCDMLVSYGLPVHDAQVFSVEEAIHICEREDKPTCLLIVENGFPLDERSPHGRYKIVERLYSKFPEIPVVFCTQESDAQFYAWAKERTRAIMTGKVAPERLAAVLEKVLQGETPPAEEPEPVKPVVKEAESSRVSIRDMFFGRKKPKESEPAQSPFKGRETPADDHEIVPLNVGSGEHVVLFQSPTSSQGQELDLLVARQEPSMEVDDPSPNSSTDLLPPVQIRTDEEPMPEKLMTPQPQTAANVDQDQNVLPAAKQEGILGGLSRAMSHIPSFGFPRGQGKPQRTPEPEAETNAAEDMLPDNNTVLEARRRPGRSSPSEKRSSPEEVQIVEKKPASRFSFPEQDVIGVFALTRGAGATRTALIIAEYLAKRGRTALVAYDGRDDLDFAGADEKNINFCFPTLQERGNAVPILRRDHQFIVIDFGTPLEITSFGMFVDDDSQKTVRILGDLMNCNRRVCCTFSAPWHEGKKAFLTNMKIDHNCVLLTEKERDMNIDDLMGKIYPGLQPGRGLAGLLRPR